MGSIFRYYMLLARRWMWILMLGAALCGSATYLISTFLRPVYQASAYLIVTIGDSAHPSITESLQAVPTFAQLLKTPTVLNPVVAEYPGMSVQDLLAMISVKPQADTQIIELDVLADSPRLAAKLANQVSQSFAHYADESTGGQETIQIIPAQPPSLPAQPRPLEDAGIGLAVGFLLTLLLVGLFEWMANRATSVEQIQGLLDIDILALVPRFARRTGWTEARQVHAEKYHLISASLDMAQASQSIRLIMFTSALAGEGKSTIVSQVAINLAQAGKQVLLVDLNIHRPALAHLFHLSNQSGLTDLLSEKSGRWRLEQYARETETPGLQVLTSGSRRMNSPALLQALAATRFFARLKQTGFDYILFDVPPLLAVAETQVLATSLEAMVLIVNGARTPRKVLERARLFLQRLQGITVLGVVVNQSSWSEYADIHPYIPPQPQLQSAQYIVEQVTLGLPAVSAELLQAPELAVQPAECFPDTGESEQVGAKQSSYVIRPSLSLSGLKLPTNGLTRRAFPENAPSETPPFFAE